MVDGRSSNLAVCKLSFNNLPKDRMWKDIRELLQNEPSRSLSTPVLASLLLFPSSHSPLGFTEYAAHRVWLRCAKNCYGIPQRITHYISAIRGFLRFVGMAPYTKVIEKALDLKELIDAQVTRYTFISAPNYFNSSYCILSCLNDLNFTR